MGIFADCAPYFCELGLAPTPTGGLDGKRPMLTGYTKRILRMGTLAPIARKFPDANIALLTGASGLNVVDIDEPELLRSMQRRFGETPLIVETAGRGGFQLYYHASPDVRAADLRRTEGLAVEVKAGGNIVIAPPSRNPKTGREYRCVEGRFDQATLAALPQLKFASVFRARTLLDHRRIDEGHRNDVLFSICLRAARHVDDFDALLDLARTRNNEAEPPLEDPEVVRLCRSAWSYQTSGRNFVGAGGHVVLSRARIEHLCADAGNPVALALRLELEHAARVQRGETFSICRRAMAETGTLAGWSERAIRTATENAVRLGFIAGFETPRGEPRQFTLPHLRSGSKIDPNVTNTPSPPSSDNDQTNSALAHCRQHLPNLFGKS